MAYMPALSYEAIADGLTVCTSSLHRFGTDAVLIGEALMRTENKAEKLAWLRGAI